MGALVAILLSCVFEEEEDEIKYPNRFHIKPVQ